MSEDVKQHALEPFFTTKQNGTGLGLAVAKSVVDAHGGEIMIVSSPHEGCCVTINLPNKESVQTAPL